jgi:hypothetical protein
MESVREVERVEGAREKKRERERERVNTHV